MSARESKLQQDCLGWVAVTHPDILAVNIHGGGFCNKGFPDLLLCIHGRFVTVELKVGNNTMQPDQRIWKRRIETAGGIHALIYNKQEFITLVERMVSGGD